MPDDVTSPPTDLHWLTIADAARQIERHVLSPVELTEALIARVEALDPQLNAFLLPTPEKALEQARIPWNRDHFTGGSSSGAGAAIAAGFVPGAMGSDTGGSIRGPAALCGIVGLKPPYGLVRRSGGYPNSFTFDHAGPMTWTVEDCAIMLQAIAGHDAKDPASADRAIPDYRAALTGGIKGLRI